MLIQNSSIGEVCVLQPKVEGKHDAENIVYNREVDLEGKNLRFVFPNFLKFEMK